MRKIGIVLAIVVFSAMAIAQAPTAVTGYCNLGATQAMLSGMLSTNDLQGEVPFCTVTVYLTGTSTPATIYADALSNPLSNPFTASGSGQWLFFASLANQYDVVLRGGIPPNNYPAPVTLTGLSGFGVYSEILNTVNNWTALQNFGGGLTATTAQIGAIGGMTPGTGNFTTLTAQNTNGALNATNFPGVDIGAKINAAIATLPNGCGEVDIPAGPPVAIPTAYSFSTQIKIPRCVRVLGQGMGGTVLTWTGGAGAAIYSGDSGSVNGPYGGSIGQFTLTQASQVVGSVGIFNGGDTGSSYAPGTSGNWGQGVNFPFIQISNFGSAFMHGNNSFWLDFISPEINGNLVGFTLEPGATGSGEKIDFLGGFLQGNTQGAFVNDYVENHLEGVSIDFNGEYPGSGFQIVNSFVMMSDCHIESHHSALATGYPLTILMSLGSIAVDSPSHSTTAGAISLSAPTTLNGTGFLATDVGWATTIAGAGPAGALLTTTITAYISSTQVTIANAASTAVSGATVLVGVMPALITTNGTMGYVDLRGTQMSSNFYVNDVISWQSSATQPFSHMRINGVYGSGKWQQWIDNMPTFLDAEIDSYMSVASTTDNNGNPVTSKLNLGQICLAGASTANCIMTHLGGTQIYGYQGSDTIKLTPGGVGGATTYTFTDGSLNTAAGYVSTSSLKIGSNIVLPSTLTGYLGTSGTKAVLGTTAGASGVLTCWKTDGSIGYCSGSVSGVSCTCN